MTFLSLGVALPAVAAPRAGVAAAVRGKVTLDRTGSVGIAVQTGAPIYLDDRIATGPQGGLQVMLLDESVFTLGPNSTLVVDRFVYDPKSDSGELQTELVRGAFRFVSGKIAKRDPSKMNVKLPAGTIGVRGTIVGVQLDATTGHALVWLGGPAAGNSAGIPAGSIAVENAGVVREVGRSGWGVEIPNFASPPTPPFPVPDSTYGTLGFEVAPPPASPTRSSADATGAPTQEGAPPPAGTSEPAPLEPLALLSGSDTLSAPAPPILLEPLGPIANPIPPPEMTTLMMESATMAPTITFTPTSLTDLVGLAINFDGHFIFDLQNVPFQSNMGDLRLIVDLDFQQDVVGVQVLNIVSSFLGTQGTGAGATSVPFSSGIGSEAKFIAQFPYFETGFSMCANGCPVSVNLDFQNIPTQVAAQLNTQVAIGTVSTIVDTTVPQSVPITTTVP